MKLYVKEIRQKKNITLNELAKEAKVAIGYLSELEDINNSKKNPSINVICKLAKALEVEPAELFECEEGNNE